MFPSKTRIVLMFNVVLTDVCLCFQVGDDLRSSSSGEDVSDDSSKSSNGTAVTNSSPKKVRSD